jgi:murE/murF fusion protein
LKNFNNEIGLPLTLLNLSSAHEWAIVEMGMNHAGEISRLSRIALPDIALVTNTGGAHLEGLGTLDNVARAKAEIFEGMREKGTAVLFADDPRRRILEEKARANKNIDQVLFFGSSDEADIRSGNIATSGTLTRFTARMEGREEEFSIHSPAVFMVANCLAAIAAALTAGIPSSGIKMGIAAFTPVSGRMDIVKMSDALTLIDDTYNANPASVTQALKTLGAMAEGKNSIAVLGDMLELGEASKKLHWEIGRQAALSGISGLYVYGDQAKHIVEGAVGHHFPRMNIFHGTKDEIARKVLENSVDETWVLVKGSRGMAMEKVIQELRRLITHHS